MKTRILQIAVLLPPPREQAVLRSLSGGNSYKMVAGELGISIETVRTHIKRIYEKTARALGGGGHCEGVSEGASAFYLNLSSNQKRSAMLGASRTLPASFALRAGFSRFDGVRICIRILTKRL